jgi:RNA polymerase sigma-70 factor (ECF subfamily)
MEISASYTDAQLLQQLASGNEKAMRQLFATYRDRLFFYITRITKSEQIAEELVMDVFMKIWTGKERLTEVQNIDAFLFRIARNKSIDFLRSAAGNTRFQELLWEQIQSASGERADTPLLVKEYEAKVREAISLLSPQRRKVYALRYERQLTHAEIATELNLSRHTVNNHLVEAQKFVHNYVAQGVDLAALLLILQLV